MSFNEIFSQREAIDRWNLFEIQRRLHQRHTLQH